MNNKAKKVYFVTGGGTGGHIYPAISIAKALRDDSTTQKVFYIGNPKNLEAKIAKDEGFEFLPIDVTSMPRKLNFDFLKWGIKLDSATCKALFYIFKYRPNAVFGTGGYVSAPAIIAALITNTPYMIHDSDAHPGIVSRYVASGAKVVSVAFSEAKNHIKNKNIKVFGNPIKQEFFNISKSDAKKELNIPKGLTLLIMGGSQGAMNINHTAINCLQYFVETLKLNVILQTGAKNYDATIEFLEKIYPEYKNSDKIIIKPYFDNMALPLNAAEIAIARAGSLSLSELSAVKIPSILIPFPYAAADHQRKNAKCYEKAGASVYIDDFELNKEKLESTVKDLISNPERLARMSESTAQFCKPNAASQILETLKEIAK